MSTALRSFCELGGLGIWYSRCANATKKILKWFEENLVSNGGRYEVYLPWKYGVEGMLEVNYTMAVGRLRSLLKLLSRTNELLKRYDHVIQQYLICNHAELVNESLKTTDRQVVYYMPHKECFREISTTTRLRVVLYAFSHPSRCKFLKDCLEMGPNLNPVLLAFLLRCGGNRIATKSDIEKAFLQIGIKWKLDMDSDFCC